MSTIILYTLLAAVVLIEAWYWLWYFPRAWRNEGTNRQVDDLRYGLTTLYGRSDEPRKP